jgi:carboxylesterase type B
MRSDEIPAVSQSQVEVPNLGTVNGISLNNKTCQYLGIPYAEIPGRFRRPVLADTPWKNGIWDGTKLG